MPLTPLLPWVLTAVVASVTGMVSGAHGGNPWLSWAAALIFAATLIATSLEINAAWWTPDPAPRDPDAPLLAAIRNTRLLIVAYMWGALALLAVYRISDLKWQHGLQYGAGMALITILLMAYEHVLARRSNMLSRPRALAIAAQVAWLHGCACLCGLSFLILSGKLASSKGDWAANQIFLSGGIAMMVLSAIAGYTQHKLASATKRPPPLLDVAVPRERQVSH